MINIKITVSSKFDKISIENIKYNIYLKTSNNKNANNEKLLSFISKQGIDRKKIIRFCLNNFNFFSIIIWNKQFLLAVSDQVSSYQLIYKKDKYNIQISDNINFFKNEKLNENSIKQIEYSGYTIDNYTVFKNVYGLKPYEYIFKNKRISEQKFYKKISITYKTKSNSRLLEKNLTRLLFNIFNEIKNKNKNNKIFVPLSAGYDSRAILSLLIEVGCKNLETFTYGRKNVRDFVIAKKISEKLGIKNHHIQISKSIAKKCYRSKNFNKYLNYLNSGNSSNNFGDFIAIDYLYQKKIVKKNDIIINGQSGDFISGNHIPLKFKKKENEIKDFINFILKKHFNLVGNKILNKDQLEIKDIIKKKYFNSISNINENYEYFEFSNRQTKWVISQQKVYDYYNLNWELPFWDRRIIKFFFKELSLKEKLSQNFFKSYLHKKNFAKVWDIEINPKQSFSFIFKFIRLFFKAMFLFNKSMWRDFEKKYLNYFLDTSLSTMIVGYFDYIKTNNIPRNSIFFYSRKYVKKFKKNYKN